MPISKKRVAKKRTTKRVAKKVTRKRTRQSKRINRKKQSVRGGNEKKSSFIGKMRKIFKGTEATVPEKSLTQQEQKKIEDQKLASQIEASNKTVLGYLTKDKTKRGTKVLLPK